MFRVRGSGLRAMDIAETRSLRSKDAQRTDKVGAKLPKLSHERSRGRLTISAHMRERVLDRPAPVGLALQTHPSARLPQIAAAKAMILRYPCTLRY